MSRSSAIKSKFADDRMERTANEVPTNSQRETTMLSDDDGRVANEIFAMAVSAIGPGKLAAAELGISEAHLSDMRNGNRTVADYRWVRMCRKNRAAGISIIRALAKLVGGVEVRERGRVDKARLRQQLEMSLERNPAMLRVVLADAADALGIDEDEAASVWDGPTLVDAIK